MSSSRRRTPLVAAVVVIALIVAGVVVVAVARAGGGDDAPFTLGNTSYGSRDAEGLLRGQRLAAARVAPIDDGDPLTVEFAAPGRRAFDFTVVRLEDDEPAMRIRQVTRADASVQVADRAVDWQSWVAEQDPGTDGAPRDEIGAWKRVGADGILVRPGRQVRLRTVFVPGPRTGACETLTLSDGPLWLAREDGSDDDWERLRHRDPRDGEDHDTRTGAHGRVVFRAGSPAACASGRRDGATLGPDAGAP
jgi:hypothetical protein